MAYLHSHDVLHRDLKPENILTDDRLFPKILDFGLSKIIHSNFSMTLQSNASIKCTPAYLSPEIIENKEYTKASDVYAFGIIVYEIMMAKRAFDDFTGHIMKLYYLIANGERLKIDDTVPEPYRKLIERCWSQNKEERPSFQQIVNELQSDEFITEMVNENDYQSYIQYINEYQSTFDKDKKIIKIENFFQNNINKSFQKVSIPDYKFQMKVVENDDNNSFSKSSKILPLKFFKELNENCQKLSKNHMMT